MRNLFLSLLLAMTLVACDKDNGASSSPELPEVTVERPITEDMKKTFIQYPKTLAALWTNISRSTQDLLNAITTFLDDPNEQHLKNARVLFQKTTQTFLYTAAFSSGIAPETVGALKRFYPGATRPEYIMGSDEYPYAGLINDLAFSMELKALKQQQAMAWPQENSLGLSVLEILLYSPSNPLEAYQPVRRWSSEIRLPIRDHPNNRLREYLKLVTSQLHTDAMNITKAWKKSEANYLQTHASRSLYKKLVQRASEALYGLTVLNTGERHFTELEPIDLSLGRLSGSDILWLKPILTSVDLALLSDSVTQIKSPKLLERLDAPNKIKRDLIDRANSMRDHPNKNNVYALLESLIEALASM